MCVKCHMSSIDWIPSGLYERRARGQGMQDSDDSAVIGVCCFGGKLACVFEYIHVRIYKKKRVKEFVFFLIFRNLNHR